MNFKETTTYVLKKRFWSYSNIMNSCFCHFSVDFNNINNFRSFFVIILTIFIHYNVNTVNYQFNTFKEFSKM